MEAKVAKLFVPDTNDAATVKFGEVSCMHWWGTAPKAAEVDETDEGQDTKGKNRLDDEIPF